jgi:uncharacterized protein
MPPNSVVTPSIDVDGVAKTSTLLGSRRRCIARSTPTASRLTLADLGQFDLAASYHPTVELRRHLTRRNLLRGLGSAGVLTAIDALAIEPRWLAISEHELTLEGLPRALEGFTIVQITDAHLSSIGPVESAIVDAVARLDPQLVVLTGDLIDDLAHGPVLEQLCAELARSSARVLATLGNWEHWGRIEPGRLAQLYARSGATLLVDAWEPWQPGDAGLAVYASDDSTGGNPRPLQPGPGAPVELLLTHSPAFVDQVTPARRFDLCLAGHTHGGQITAAGLAPVLPPGSGRFVAGWYETQLGPLYVSRGTGTSVVPARLCCRPELPVIRLRRA